MSWGQFLAIDATLAANRANGIARQRREGTAMCSLRQGHASRYQGQYPQATCVIHACKPETAW
jgi:hypothetical protein